MGISVDQDGDDEDDGDEGATARGWRAEGALWFPVKSQRKSRSAEAAANHPEGTLCTAQCKEGSGRRWRGGKGVTFNGLNVSTLLHDASPHFLTP